MRAKLQVLCCFLVIKIYLETEGIFKSCFYVGKRLFFGGKESIMVVWIWKEELGDLMTVEQWRAICENDVAFDGQFFLCG